MKHRKSIYRERNSSAMRWIALERAFSAVLRLASTEMQLTLGNHLYDHISISNHQHFVNVNTYNYKKINIFESYGNKDICIDYCVLLCCFRILDNINSFICLIFIV